MSSTIHGVNIAGITASLPTNVLSLKDMSETFGEEQIDRIIASSGVRNLRMADEKTTTSDLCVHAAEHLFKCGNIDHASIDAIIFISQTFDYKIPATSAIMQHRLNLTNETLAFDIAYGCSGYVYGLFQAGMLISTGVCDRVLVCAGDISTKLSHPKDRSTRVLFGDAGSATLVEKGEGTMFFHFYTDGSGGKHLCIPAGGSRLPYSPKTWIEQTDAEGNIRTLSDLYMNGFEILNFAIKHVPFSVEEALKEAGLTKEEIDVFAFHQANEFMLNHLRKKMKIKAERLPIVLKDTGNTSSASIPLALSLEAEKLRVHSNLNKVLCCGFGVGLSIGSTVVDLSKTIILEPCEYV